MNEVKILLMRLSEMEKDAYLSPAQTWEEYQRRVGKYLGIKEAVDMIIELQNPGEDD